VRRIRVRSLLLIWIGGAGVVAAVDDDDDVDGIVDGVADNDPGYDDRDDVDDGDCCCASAMATVRHGRYECTSPV
jgi:hypothetical protein